MLIVSLMLQNISQCISFLSYCGPEISVPKHLSVEGNPALSYPKGLHVTLMPRSHFHLSVIYAPSHMYSFGPVNKHNAK